MSAVPASAVPAAPVPKTESATMKVEDQVSGMQQEPQAAEVGAPPVNWESEIQLVSSLAKLQELERKIHELRHVLPSKLLEPLSNLGNQSESGSIRYADSPVFLRDGLDQAARSQIANIESFKSTWQGPELKPVWAHVESRIKESNGQILQPTGMWEQDYDVLLKELLQNEKTKEEERLREEEVAERTKIQSTDDGWSAVVESFSQRNVPGVHVIKGKGALSLAVALSKAGIIFQIEGLNDSDSTGVAEWHVSSKAPPGRVPTKIENSIVESLNARSRKWDLAFLLDMISSYADLKRTPCVKCNKLTNDSAQLPTIRRVQSTQSSQQEPRVFTFDALHSSCA